MVDTTFCNMKVSSGAKASISRFTMHGWVKCGSAFSVPVMKKSGLGSRTYSNPELACFGFLLLHLDLVAVKE